MACKGVFTFPSRVEGPSQEQGSCYGDRGTAFCQKILVHLSVFMLMCVSRYMCVHMYLLKSIFAYEMGKTRSLGTQWFIAEDYGCFGGQICVVTSI